MAGLGKLYITAEIEPIVKLYCEAISCKHNLFKDRNDGIAACNLKRLTLGIDAKCTSYEKRQEGGE